MTNGYTGPTVVGGGTLEVFNVANGGSASAIGAAASASLLDISASMTCFFKRSLLAQAASEPLVIPGYVHFLVALVVLVVSFVLLLAINLLQWWSGKAHRGESAAEDAGKSLEPILVQTGA